MIFTQMFISNMAQQLKAKSQENIYDYDFMLHRPRTFYLKFLHRRIKITLAGIDFGRQTSADIRIKVDYNGYSIL